MDENVSKQSQQSNRFIFSDEFYDQFDNAVEESAISFDVPEISSPNVEKKIEEEPSESFPSFFMNVEKDTKDSNFNIPKSEITSIEQSKEPQDNLIKLENMVTESDISENTTSEEPPFIASIVQEDKGSSSNKENSNFNVQTGINTALEQEILKSKMESSRIPIVENTNFYEKPSEEKMVYRARRNAPQPPVWLEEPSKPEIMEDIIPIPERKESLLEEMQPEIINIDELLEQQKELNAVSSIEQKIDYEKDLSDSPITKSNLLNELREKENLTGKISILARYGEDFCNKDYITNPAIGRTEEIKQLILILLTPEKSAILVGKPGIGKTSIVEGLAYQIQRNNVPDVLKGYRIVSIKTTSLLGTLPTGETRLQTLIDELKELDKIILFIDEIHMLMGATNESSLDFANMFKESLGRGSIKMIGATTSDEYERYILRDKAFVRRFQRVDVEEPTREQTIEILMGTLPKIEKNTGAILKYSKFIQSEIMAFIVDITTEYKRVYGIGSRYPDICLTLLSQAFSQAVFENRKEVNIYDVRNAIQNSKNIYPDVIRKELINFDNKFIKLVQEIN